MTAPRSWLGSAAAAGSLIYVALVAVLHLVRTDHDPAGRYLSEYSVGRFGYLGNAAVYVLAATLLLVSAGLRFTVRASLGLTLSCVLLALASAAFVTIAAFPADVQPMGGARPTPTHSGAIHHQAALVALLSLIPGLLILPIALRRDPRWRTFFRTASLLALLFVATVVAFSRLPWSQGWAERAGAVTLSTVLFLTALRVRKCTSLGAQREPSP